MDLEKIIRDAGDEHRTHGLHTFLEKFLNPAFGALPKSEIELLVLNLLVDLKIIKTEPTIYDLVTTLKVTRAKARKLIYERELRRLSEVELDDHVKELLKRPLIQKQGELFILEVENPLVSDHLRAKVQQLGYVSDGSFSPSLVKLPLDAIVSLIELYLTQTQRSEVQKALIAAGAPDNSFKGVVKAVLKKVGAKIAASSGEVVMDNAAKYLTPIIEAKIDVLTDYFRDIFVQTNESPVLDTTM